VVLTVMPLGEYLVWRVTSTSAQAEAEATDPIEVGEVTSTPNVYLFVLDEYGRNDSLDQVLDYDNRSFYDDLRTRGFVVEEDVHAPFQQTIPAMASVLDMDYVVTTPDEAEPGMDVFTDRLRGENATVRYFDALGYDYVYSSPGLYDWNRCVEDIADLCIEPQGKGLYLSELQRSLLDLTPIGALDLAREATTDPDYVVDQLEEHRDEIDEPFFLYSHIISPHWPFRYTEDCELRSRFGYTARLLNKSEFDRDRYVQDMGCINKKILDGVDAIIERDPDAIVIVMSDHGSKFIPDGAKPFGEWRPEAIREELGILYAMRVPEGCEQSVRDTTNSVNTFRLVAACLAGVEPDLVDDRAFIWPHVGSAPEEIVDLELLDPTS
jgi:hypothetical protein